MRTVRTRTDGGRWRKALKVQGMAEAKTRGEKECDVSMGLWVGDQRNMARM